MNTFLGRLPSGSREPDPVEVVNTILEQAEGLPLDALTTLSGAASRQVERLHLALRGETPHTPGGDRAYAKLVEWERAERELRRRVRAHPVHSYEGL